MPTYDPNTTYIIYPTTIGPSFEDVCGNIYTLDSAYPSYTYTNSDSKLINVSFNFPPSDPNSPANSNPLAGMNTVILGTNCSNISQFAFYDCSSLTTVTIQPSGLTNISNYAFYVCSNLSNINIGNGVTSIGNSAFSGCSSLTSIIIPSTVNSIGATAFQSCSSLFSVTIPSSVTTIGINAFQLCSSLKNVLTNTKSNTNLVYTSGPTGTTPYDGTNIYSSFFGGPPITVTLTPFISGLSSPLGIAISGNKLYVVNTNINGNVGSGIISTYDASSGVEISGNFITGLSSPHGIAISGNNLYVVNTNINGNVGSGIISTYDASTGLEISGNFITGLSSPHGIAISGNNLYVVNTNINGNGNVGTGIISTYDATTGLEISGNFITSLNSLNGIAINGNNLYTTNLQYQSQSNTYNGTISTYDATTGLEISGNFITGLHTTYDIAISDNNLYVTNWSDPVVGQYDATTGAIVNANFIPKLNTYTTGIAISIINDIKYLYVASFNSAGGIGYIYRYIISTSPVTPVISHAANYSLGVSYKDTNGNTKTGSYSGSLTSTSNTNRADALKHGLKLAITDIGNQLHTLLPALLNNNNTKVYDGSTRQPNLNGATITLTYNVNDPGDPYSDPNLGGIRWKN